jgi:signal transduction histidine kinase
MTQCKRPGYVRPAGAGDHSPAGPAMTALRAVAAWTARTIRCLAIAYIAAQIVIWHSFYASGPWRLAGPLAAMAWGCMALACMRGRWLRWRWHVADAAASAALALGAGWCVPQASRGDTTNWLYIAIVGQIFIPAWLAPMTLAAPLALISAAAYLAGTAVTPVQRAGGSVPAASAALLLAIAAAAWCARWMFERSAVSADAALADAHRDASEQRVKLSRNTERREHERLLHDTVLNTLTALARPGGTDASVLAGLCRRDVALMDYALSDPYAPARVAGRPLGDLLIGIEAVAIEMRARGLDVHVSVADGGGLPGGGLAGGALAGGRAGARGPAGAAVPVPVAVAMAHAVREALMNIARHAGTGQARVEVGPAPPDGLLVTVSDAGTGFDPAAVDPARLGLRRSIVERVADVGGHASVRSAPGAGTEVKLAWAPPAPGRGQAGAGPGGAGAPGTGRVPW